MADNTKIQWTDHTFNPWMGCTKVSPACRYCYAERLTKFRSLAGWGSRAQRCRTSENNWKKPLKWNRDAELEGRRHRVFCASLADVFEAKVELNPWREQLWQLIEATPWLDWQLLTKRPQRIRLCVPWGDRWPDNVWIGATVELQRYADRRIPELLQHPAAVRFLSCEPLLGKLDLTPYLDALQWVIVGGESGPHARPTHPAWFRSVRDQCHKHGVPYFLKQWGNWRPCPHRRYPNARTVSIDVPDTAEVVTMYRLGRVKDAGRVLDGRIWDEFP